jgi:hypothetical protein
MDDGTVFEAGYEAVDDGTTTTKDRFRPTALLTKRR